MWVEVAPCDQGIHAPAALFVVSHGELTARQDFGSEDGGDAAHPQRLPGSVESLDELLYVGPDGAVLTLHCPIAKVFRSSKAP